VSKPFTSLLSMAFGSLATKSFWPPLQRLINRSYVRLLGLDMTEFKPPEHYSSLNALFTRPLEVRRPFSDDPSIIISPVDARVTECGMISEAKVHQIKGMRYRIDALLGSSYFYAIHELEGGSYINLYLSPKDYHRYHVPFDMVILSMTHIPGKLYPVNLPALRHKKNLFIENERVVIESKDSKGYRHFIVLVGALNVGKMRVTFEDDLRTNSGMSKGDRKHYTYHDLRLRKDDLLGWFEMGSTVLLFSQKDAASYRVELDQNVRFADPIGRLL
jgi:phosphatidylserine decarboxylase